ncbi:LysM peptidoglycan-binding domain-containing protein [Rhodopirellula sp. JC639]|uniref:LysM peptidoglycan-binding domain-containing protein n=1 Tax=Stieleria mannarensis TaxID=2755585 RepID=UPI0015FEE5E1|nr:LysM peptidoglycan-binding domain-containing protein [Rhodopirellula sp. JC639]
MATIQEPARKAPWPPIAATGKQPVPYPVGQKEGETFGTIAKDHGLDAKELIRFNFGTLKSAEINWYLVNYVQCPRPSRGQKYVHFRGAKYDAANKTGMIFLPGAESQPQDNVFGNKVVELYNNLSESEKYPNGLCYQVAYNRVKAAANQVGVALPPLSSRNSFGRLWGSFINTKTNSWFNLPEKYRGKGAAGAMAFAKLGTLVDQNGIWAGNLKPGAVIQTWSTKSNYELVRDNQRPRGIGHSFIFLRYSTSGSTIDGMHIADQGYQGRRVLARGKWGWWVGANLVQGG